VLEIGAPSRRASYTVSHAHLRVLVTGREPYVVKARTMIPSRRFAGARAGSLVPVWVDPAAPERVAIDWSKVPTADEILALLKHRS
jgi:hypothetical protein